LRPVLEWGLGSCTELLVHQLGDMREHGMLSSRLWGGTKLQVLLGQEKFARYQFQHLRQVAGGRHPFNLPSVPCQYPY